MRSAFERAMYVIPFEDLFKQFKLFRLLFFSIISYYRFIKPKRKKIRINVFCRIEDKLIEILALPFFAIKCLQVYISKPCIYSSCRIVHCLLQVQQGFIPFIFVKSIPCLVIIVSKKKKAIR